MERDGGDREMKYLVSISASSFMLCSSGFVHRFLSPNIPHHMSLRGLIAVL